MSSLSAQKEGKVDLGAGEQIKRFHDFFESKYMAEFMEAARLGKKSVSIDFSELSKFDPDLSELILDQPEEVLKAADLAVEELDLPKHTPFQLRLANIAKTERMMIREIRSEHIARLIFVEGIVRNKSDVRPQVTIARFECPACGAVIPIPQLDTKFREPSSCSCGRKGKFRVLGKELVDAQGIVLEESPQDLDGGEQPKRMNVFLKNDLVSPMSEKRTNPGTKIRVVGTLKEVPIPAKDGGKLTRFDLMIDANNVEATEEDFGDIIVSEDEEKQIKELSADPRIFQKMVDAIAPSIYGHDKVKEALILQLMGGVRKKRTDGVVTRGDIHVLLIGDPGSGKSQMLKRMVTVAPKARYVSGKGVSGAGLTAAVVKDEFLRGWSLEAGALVLANRGICMIDEMDKMGKEDRAAMHEALEQQTVSISKANIQATLRSETTVLAAANPKFGRFDPYGTITEQIDLPPTLINRFDLIFPIKDLPNPERDEEMSRFILGLHQNQVKEGEIPTHLLRKYIALAKKLEPVLTDAAIEEINEYYLKMRSSGTEESGIKSVPISARQLEALVRLSEASAKLRFSDKVTKKDARRAIDLLHYCLSQIGIDPETGKIDIDRISTGMTASQRGKIHLVKEVIAELESRMGKPIPMEEVIKECKEKGIEEDRIDDIIEKLKREGDIFEPRRGFIQRI